MKSGDKIKPIFNYKFRHPLMPDNRPMKNKIYQVNETFDLHGVEMIVITGLVGIWTASNFKVIN